ncbi:MAG: hypothetical protein JWN98_1268 [Abditibacteriota bacterium]|nr:hypothetical protein [Abditibacteriota bacterium]
MKSSVLLTGLMAMAVIPVAATLLTKSGRHVRAAEAPASTSTPGAAWSNGLPTDPNYFPIAVWLQSPQNATKYKSAGINLYVGLWQGPTEAQLAALKASGMPVICEQNEVGLAHKADKAIVGWMHGDEPDNAQPIKDPATGKQSWGGPVPPARIVADYEKLRAADPTRPILLNLGQGVANDEWIGRGTGAHIDDYLTYVKGGDIISFDVYPVAGLKDGENRLWYVPKGIDRLKKWTEGKKRIWNCIEASRIDNEKAMASPAQVRAQVWMSLVHGSTGLIYFVHQFKPTFNEHALLDDPILLPAVTAINRQIQELAPVLNSPTIAAATVKSATEQAPIDLMAKRHGGSTYVFAVGMRNVPSRASFQVQGVGNAATVEVLGEGRTIALRNGRFEDDFKPYDVHLYRISGTAQSG